MDEKLYVRLIKVPNTWMCNLNEQVSHDYTIEDTYTKYRPDVIEERVKTDGRYVAWAFMDIESRKRPVLVSIGFDADGYYQIFKINNGKGKFSKKEKIHLLNTLVSWLIEDGWAIIEL